MTWHGLQVLPDGVDSALAGTVDPAEEWKIGLDKDCIEFQRKISVRNGTFPFLQMSCRRSSADHTAEPFVRVSKQYRHKMTPRALLPQIRLSV